MNLFERISFVLCRPLQAGNVGAAARALKNMGFADLRVVAPIASLQDRAAISMAVHADDVLQNAGIYSDLSSALSDRTITVGTTSRSGGYRSDPQSLRDAARELICDASTNRIAIVFGPEDHGLTNDELKLCHRLVTIPASSEYPSMNLAQAVMVTAYELRQALLINIDSMAETPELAASDEVEAMFQRMSEALLAIGFLPEENPDHIMFALRGLFGRSGLTPRELDILNGIARQTKWVAEGGAATLAAKRAAGAKLK
jgi:tRNA/rRNA methyltransferase